MPSDIKNETTFLEEYVNEISPKLKNIDIFIKELDESFTIDEVSKLLYISYEEVVSIIKQENISNIDKEKFFNIMVKGSSEICKLYKRELEVGSPHIYSKEDVAYIYNIDLQNVHKACDDLKIKEVTSYSMIELFSYIKV